MNNFDINNCTVPEAINYSLTKIIEQGGRCTDEWGACLHSHNGRHCAVGWLLDHKEAGLMCYRGDLTQTVRLFGDKVPALIRQNIAVFKALQTLHDNVLCKEPGGERDLVQSVQILIPLGADMTLIKNWLHTGRADLPIAVEVFR